MEEHWRPQHELTVNLMGRCTLTLLLQSALLLQRRSGSITTCTAPGGQRALIGLLGVAFSTNQFLL